MGNDIFADTSGLFAFLDKQDDMHRSAGEILREAAEKRTRFVTTDYIIDETATLLMSRDRSHLAEVLFEIILSSKACAVEWMDPDRFGRTRSLFLKHKDQKWSFTDCFSFVIMNERKIERALTKDSHFRKAGFVPLLVR